MTIKPSTNAFEKASVDKPELVLRLYIAGSSGRSTRAIENAKDICERHLEGRYRLEVIDIYTQPMLARDDQVLAVPTLVKKAPPPIRRFIGDLSDRARVLRGLEIES